MSGNFTISQTNSIKKQVSLENNIIEDGGKFNGKVLQDDTHLSVKFKINKQKTKAEISLENLKQLKILDNSNVNIDNYSLINLFIENHTYINKLKDSVQNMNVNHQLIYPDDTFFMMWNITLFLILIITIILIPLEFSEKQINTYLWYKWLNIVFEWFFILDILINSLTVYSDEQNNLVEDFQDIIKNQLMNWFMLDLLSSIPTSNMNLIGLSSTNSSAIFSLNPQMLKILKMPKYIRFLNVLDKLSKSRTVDVFWDILEFLGLHTFINRFNKFLIFTMLFLLLIHFFSCIFISIARDHPHDNWYKRAMETEQILAMENPFYKDIELRYLALFFPDQPTFQSQILEKNSQIQVMAWQFTVQTMTSVGQGDISSATNNEKVMRCVAMIIGVMQFSAFCASITELIIFDSSDTLEMGKRNGMISQIVSKQNLQSDARKNINMLSTSIYEKKLLQEFGFIDQLPEFYSHIVFTRLFGIQKEKITFLGEHNFKFFIELYKKSTLRKCIENEQLVKMNQPMTKIFFIQNGKAAINIPKFRDIMNNFCVLLQGSDFGYGCQVNKGISLQEIKCLTDSDVICIDRDVFLDIFNLHSLTIHQGFIARRIRELLMELFILLTFKNYMIKIGVQVDQTWMNDVIQLLKLKKQDLVMMDKAIDRMVNCTLGKTKMGEVSKMSTEDAHLQKWYHNQITTDMLRQVTKRSKKNQLLILNKGLQDKYPKLFK